MSESGAIESVNAGMERIFGYDRSELIGQPLELIVPEAHRRSHADDRSRFFANPQLRAMAGRNVSGRRKDGSTVPLEVGLNVAQIGGRRVAIGMVTDITERKRLEEQSAALGTLVDLQQQLTAPSAGPESPAKGHHYNGVGTRTMLDRALEDPEAAVGSYAAVFSIQRLQQMSDRFGDGVTHRLVVFVGQYIGNSLCEEGDRLFRWDNTTFVALLGREGSASEVQREVSEVSGKRLDYFMDYARGNALVRIELRSKVLPLAGAATAEIAEQIEQAARGSK
jgi:PAS domain S-box-containing protein